MATKHRNFSVACVVILAASIWYAPHLVLSIESRKQSNKNDVPRAAQLAVACSPEKPVAEPGDTISLRAFSASPDSQSLQYSWSATAGKIVGQGAKVVWNFSGVYPGKYYAVVQVTDSIGRSATCSVEVILRLLLETRDPLRETGKSFLLPDEAEKEGHGLYSYLLFAFPPSEASLERYRQAIGAFLKLIPDITALEKYRSLDSLNVTYLPVDSYPEKDMSFDHLTDWVLEHYDYVRARLLLAAIPETLRRGPYLISSNQPLTLKTTKPRQYLKQDLSIVPAERNIIHLWVIQFLNQAAQERYWDEDTMERFVLKLRTTIAILAEGFADVLNALDKLIKWVD